MSGTTIDELRSKLAGWHFAKESLADAEREILAVAEAVLAELDRRDDDGYALVAIIEQQADRIAWLEGDVAGWRIKLDTADAALQWIAEHYPAALRELPTDEWLRLRRASTSLAETPTETTT